MCNTFQVTMLPPGPPPAPVISHPGLKPQPKPSPNLSALILTSHPSKLHMGQSPSLICWPYTRAEVLRRGGISAQTHERLPGSKTWLDQATEAFSTHLFCPHHGCNRSPGHVCERADSSKDTGFLGRGGDETPSPIPRVLTHRSFCES